MQMILNKGHRIRASDKYLVYRFCAGTLLSLFLLVLILLNMGQLMRTDWEHFSLLDNGLTLFPLQLHNRIDSGWCLCISRFSLLPLPTGQFQEAPAPPKAGKNGAE